MRHAAVRKFCAVFALASSPAWALGASAQEAAVPPPEGPEIPYAAPDPANSARLKLWRRVQDALPALIDRKAEEALAPVADAETKSALARRLAARRQQVELTLSEIDDWDATTADVAAAADIAGRLRAQLAPLLADLADARSYAAGKPSPYELGAVRASVSADVLGAQRALLDALAAWGLSDAWASRSGSLTFAAETPGLSVTGNFPSVRTVTNPLSGKFSAALAGTLALRGAALPGAEPAEVSFSGTVVLTDSGAYLATDAVGVSAHPGLWNVLGVDAQGLAQLLGALRGNVLYAPASSLEAADVAGHSAGPVFAALAKAPAFAAQRLEPDGSVSLGWDPAFLAALSDSAQDDSAQSAALLNLDGSAARRLPDGSMRWELASDAASGTLTVRRVSSGWSADALLSGAGEGAATLRAAAAPSSFAADWSAPGGAVSSAAAAWDGTRLDASASGAWTGRPFVLAVSGPLGSRSANLSVSLGGFPAGTVAWSSDRDGSERASADLALPALGASFRMRWSGVRSTGSEPSAPAGTRVEFGGFTDGVN